MPSSRVAALKREDITAAARDFRSAGNCRSGAQLLTDESYPHGRLFWQRRSASE